MARPIEALQGVRGLLAPGGALVIADEKVADAFTAPGDEVERMFYSYSVLFCLPNSLAEAVRPRARSCVPAGCAPRRTPALVGLDIPRDRRHEHARLHRPPATPAPAASTRSTC